jgi:hypothetical protein
MFHGASILGFFTGFFINVFYSQKTFSTVNSMILSEKTFGPIINLVIAIAFLIFIICKYSEAKSESFSKLAITQNNSNRISKDDSLDLNASSSDDGQNVSIDIQRDSIMVENIDAELEMFNKKNKYDDTNLVTRSVHEIAEQEKDNLKVLMKAYFVFILIVFTTKYINEAIVIYFGLNLIKENPEFLKEHHWVHGLVLSGAYLLVILCVLALSKKVECTRDKFFLIIILSLNLINCSLLIFFSQNKIEILIICSALAIILSNLIQKTASHYFFNIIPSYYILCRIQGNILLL